MYFIEIKICENVTIMKELLDILKVEIYSLNFLSLWADIIEIESSSTSVSRSIALDKECSFEFFNTK